MSGSSLPRRGGSRLWSSILGVVGGGGHPHRHQRAGGCAPAQRADRPHPTASLHARARYSSDPGGVEGADYAAAVLLARSRHPGSRLWRLRRPGARDATRIHLALGWESKTRILQSRAVQRNRRPRHGLRLAGRAARSGRRECLFRPRRHQSARRRAHRRVLPARSRALPRIRSFTARLRTIQSQAPLSSA